MLPLVPRDSPIPSFGTVPSHCFGTLAGGFYELEEFILFYFLPISQALFHLVASCECIPTKVT